MFVDGTNLRRLGNRDHTGARLSSSADRADLGIQDIHAGSADLQVAPLTSFSAVTVVAPWVKTNTIITVTATTILSVSGGSIYISDITEGESFTIESDLHGDDRTINWIAVEATQ